MSWLRAGRAAQTVKKSQDTAGGTLGAHKPTLPIASTAPTVQLLYSYQSREKRSTAVWVELKGMRRTFLQQGFLPGFLCEDGMFRLRTTVSIVQKALRQSLVLTPPQKFPHTNLK